MPPSRLNPEFLIFDSHHPLPKTYRGGVVVIGNFDGVHRGHQAVLAQAMALAQGKKPVTALSFEPHPRTVFQSHNPVFRLSPPQEKAKLFQACGLDGVLNITFSHAFANLSAQDFIDQVLVQKMGASHVVVGYNFHFGHRREGTPQLLSYVSQQTGFKVSVVERVSLPDGKDISSSHIRAYLEGGHVEEANSALGFRWFVIDTVIHGQKRGRILGYPTANMQLHENCRLAHGVYAVAARLQNGRLYHGVASYGRRPHFDNGKALLETKLFGYSGTLYGQNVQIIFHELLRAEKRFDSTDELIAQMDRDSKAAQVLLAKATPLSDLDARLSF